MGQNTQNISCFSICTIDPTDQDKKLAKLSMKSPCVIVYATTINIR